MILSTHASVWIGNLALSSYMGFLGKASWPQELRNFGFRVGNEHAGKNKLLFFSEI